MYRFLQKWWNMINLLFFSVKFYQHRTTCKECFYCFYVVHVLDNDIWFNALLWNKQRYKKNKNVPTDKILLSYIFDVPTHWMMFSNFPGTYKYVIVSSFYNTVYFLHFTLLKNRFQHMNIKFSFILMYDIKCWAYMMLVLAQ